MILRVPGGDLPLTRILCHAARHVQRRCRKRSRSSIDRLWKALTGAGRESVRECEVLERVLLTGRLGTGIVLR